MNLGFSFIKEHWTAGVAAILGWGVGFLMDIGKEHFKRNLRLREEHAKEIQNEILAPIYNHLNGFYLPVCQMEMSPLEVSAKQIHRKEVGSVAENPYVQTEHAITIKALGILNWKGNLTYTLPPWPKTEGFLRYFDDALKRHYPDLLQRWQGFRDGYESAAHKAQQVAESFIPKLQEAIGLKAGLAGCLGPEPDLWANYPELALLVFHRQMGITNESLSSFDGVTISGGARVMEIKTSRRQKAVIRCGGPKDSKKIIDIVDQIAKDSSGVDGIKILFKNLEAEAEKLIKDVRFALAKKPSPRRCSMV
jgi:hypothetical protein